MSGRRKFNPRAAGARLLRLAGLLCLALAIRPQAKAQVAAEIGVEFNFNHTDFMLGPSIGAAFTDLDASAKLSFLGRAGSKRVQIVAGTPDTYYQFRERRYLLGIELEKRFMLTEFSGEGGLGVLLAAWGGLSFGDYRGSGMKPPGGFNYGFKAGAYLGGDGVFFRFGYLYLPLRTNSIFNHRIFLSFHFTLE